MAVRDDILVAEAKALEIKENANLEAKKIVDDAKIKGQEKSKEILDEANSYVTNLNLQNEEKIRLAKEESITKVNEEKEKLSALANTNNEKAKQLVLERIL